MTTSNDPRKLDTQHRATRLIASNKRAGHEYFILQTLEAGVVLTGTEIKAVREGKISIAEAYARITDNELWLVGSRISPYTHGSYTNHDPDRQRKLLVHKSQIRELREMVQQKGLTLLPLRVRLKDGLAKIDIGVGRGKKLYDKRAAEAEKEGKRDMERALKDRS
ncbi:MAG: SsrA-binding protein SmpB [Thermomicrobiales bacterium]